MTKPPTEKSPVTKPPTEKSPVTKPPTEKSSVSKNNTKSPNKSPSVSELSEKITNPNKEILQQYANSKVITSESGFCYIGEDNNNRHCVNAYGGDVCTSGDVYNRIDKCLKPDSFR